MADDMYGGYAPKQGRFGCLPKVLHDAKPTKQATFDTPFLYNQEVYRQSVGPAVITGLFLFQNIISCIFFLPIHCLLVTS